MPTFSSDRAIFLQMADRLSDDILMGRYMPDERVPSVREYAVAMEVNVNTAVKSYEHLCREGVIYNKRGMGYFVSPGAKDRILDERKKEFMDATLPELFRNMSMLGIEFSEVAERFEAYSQTK